MQRVLETGSTSAAACVACEHPLEGDRCSHCGAAARAGPWRILRVISRSPHGAMYLAEDDAGAKVALKELVFSLVPTTQELDAFTREAELLRALDHPRIPKFLSSFTVGQGVSTRLYLAQQYLPGQSLADRLATEHFDEASVLALARQALEVLRYLHGRSPVVVHRDVKPGNFILGANGVLSLVDFGAARSVKQAGTHRGTLVGTFGYMAPEQLGGTVDARSDLYGLGATLVHLLTRAPPEQLLTPGMELDFKRHVNVSVKTERFLARLVATQPQQRFSSAVEALAFLDGDTRSRTSSGWMARGLAAFGLALVAGSFAFVSARRDAPEKTVEAPAPPRRLEDVKLPETRPPPGTIDFPHKLAEWNFGKPGHWIIDASGRGHHALLPVSGISTDFFGLVWDGTSGMTVPDSKDFAPTGPFTVSIHFGLLDRAGPITKPSTLISRGDPNGVFAWAVQLVPGRGEGMIRFSISDAAGQVSVLEAPLPLMKGQVHQSVDVSFDPKSGVQRIVSGCAPFLKMTSVRPARELPEGSTLQLVTGFRGRVREIELIKGLMEPTETANGGCSKSGTRIGED